MNISTFIWGGRRTLSSFAHKHIGIRSQDLPNMLSVCKTDSLDKLIDNVNPNSHKIPYDIPDIPPQNEYNASKTLKTIMNKNNPLKSFIGMGYYNTYTPYPIKRHVLENQLWYT